ncbi:MAG: hypothetical protein DMG38_11585 [Acidobacteria bacterium]|nr:MAG: hypothetical protein DMG38_11585 [Acidobacteriota bacterium]
MEFPDGREANGSGLPCFALAWSVVGRPPMTRGDMEIRARAFDRVGVSIAANTRYRKGCFRCFRGTIRGQFGVERLHRLGAENRFARPRGLLEKIFAATGSFSGGCEQKDGLAATVFQYSKWGRR